MLHGNSDSAGLLVCRDTQLPMLTSEDESDISEISHAVRLYLYSNTPLMWMQSMQFPRPEAKGFGQGLTCPWPWYRPHEYGVRTTSQTAVHSNLNRGSPI